MCCIECSHICGNIPKERHCLTCRGDEEAWVLHLDWDWLFSLETSGGAVAMYTGGDHVRDPRSKLSKLKSSIPVWLYL